VKCFCRMTWHNRVGATLLLLLCIVFRLSLHLTPAVCSMNAYAGAGVLKYLVISSIEWA
jgi:hypothetical protein